MSLTPGTRIGVYEITAQIGAGGMGEVYRATDTKLKRQVAIKVLPPSLAADRDRLARFEREAEVLASVNHPNIAAIYGLEESAGIIALVMELVEGDDLSQRIARGAIPIDEALPIAKQTADALEAAHEQNIIHRDLKPANIKVRSDGTVKVLDLGLAKAIDVAGQAGGAGKAGGAAAGRPASPALPALTSPTLTSPAQMTGVGVILGTAAYMAPEQAKGHTVDRRADVWAFGVVLFEILTGTRAFEGDGIADTLGNVMKVEPNWQRLPASIPPRVVQVVRACLQKNPKQRIADVQDERLALEGAFDTAAPQTTAAKASASRGRLPWIVALAAVAAVAIALAFPTLRHLRETLPPSPPETRVDVVTPATDRPTDFALSPDGRQIVFVAAGNGASRLWRRSLATTTAQPLAGTEGALSPFWSPDGRSIGFFASGQLKRIDLGGGAPQTVAAAPTVRGGTWNADGVMLFATPPGPLLRVPASGGAPVAVTTFAGQASHRWPSFLPDGRHFLFYAQGAPDSAGIYLGALDAPDTHRLTAADAAGVFLPSGRSTGSASAEARGASEGGWLLWVRAGTLVAQRLDVARAALTGDPVTLADAVAVDAAFNVAAVSVSASGLVAYRSGAGGRRQLTWVDRWGRRSARWAHPTRICFFPPACRRMDSGSRWRARRRATWTSGCSRAPVRAGSRSTRRRTNFPSGPPTALGSRSPRTTRATTTSTRRRPAARAWRRCSWLPSRL